jgi:hypothetical protein
MASNAIVKIPEPAIFLSASVPVEGRSDYIQTASPARIREAILALVSKVLDHFNLVFGGHPAITPLIWNSASALGKEKKVFIFQSKWFENKILNEAKQFNNFIWTPKGESLEESLRIFREWMLNPENGYAPHYEYAVFIGGMEGIEEEYNIIRHYQRMVKIIPVASTGGATLKLIQRDELFFNKFKEKLINEKNYRKLFRLLLYNAPKKLDNLFEF